MQSIASFEDTRTIENWIDLSKTKKIQILQSSMIHIYLKFFQQIRIPKTTR